MCRCAHTPYPTPWLPTARLATDRRGVSVGLTTLAVAMAMAGAVTLSTSPRPHLKHASSAGGLPSAGAVSGDDGVLGGRRSLDEHGPPGAALLAVPRRASPVGGGGLVQRRSHGALVPPKSPRTPDRSPTSVAGGGRVPSVYVEKQASLSSVPAEVRAQLGEAGARRPRPRLRLDHIPEALPHDHAVPMVGSPAAFQSPAVAAATVSVAAGTAAAALLAAQEEAAEAVAAKVRARVLPRGRQGGIWLRRVETDGQALADNLRIKQHLWNRLFVGDLSVLVRICRATEFSSGPTLANAIIGTRLRPGRVRCGWRSNGRVPSVAALLRQQGSAESFLRLLLTDRIRCARTALSRPCTSKG
jgi:hypothetical protein